MKATRRSEATRPSDSWSTRSRPMAATASADTGFGLYFQETEGLMASDLLIAFVECRVLPLQGRPHPIFRMSGHRDPSQLCTKEMPTAEVA